MTSKQDKDSVAADEPRTSPAELLAHVRPEWRADDVEMRVEALSHAQQRRARRHRRANMAGLTVVAIAAAGLLAMIAVKQLGSRAAGDPVPVAAEAPANARVANRTSAGFHVHEQVGESRVWISGPDGPRPVYRQIKITSRRPRR